MPLEFWKYQGLGNDFVVVNGPLMTAERARLLCDRRRGIGADGSRRPGCSQIVRIHLFFFARGFVVFGGRASGGCCVCVLGNADGESRTASLYIGGIAERRACCFALIWGMSLAQHAAVLLVGAVSSILSRSLGLFLHGHAAPVPLCLDLSGDSRLSYPRPIRHSRPDYRPRARQRPGPARQQSASQAQLGRYNLSATAALLSRLSPR